MFPCHYVQLLCVNKNSSCIKSVAMLYCFWFFFILTSYFFIQVMEIQRFPACTSTTLMGWMTTTSTTGTWLYLRFEIPTLSPIERELTSLVLFIQELFGPVRAAPASCSGWLFKKPATDAGVFKVSKSSHYYYTIIIYMARTLLPPLFLKSDTK